MTLGTKDASHPKHVKRMAKKGADRFGISKGQEAWQNNTSVERKGSTRSELDELGTSNGR